MDNKIIKLDNYLLNNYNFCYKDIKKLNKEIIKFKRKMKTENVNDMLIKLGYEIKYIDMNENEYCKIDDHLILLNSKELNIEHINLVLAIVLISKMTNKNIDIIDKNNFISLFRNKEISNFLSLLLIDAGIYIKIFNSLVPLNIDMNKAFEILEKCFTVPYFIAVNRYNLIIEEGI